MVFGCWALCYLEKKDREAFLANAERSLLDDRHLVLIEPVLRVGEGHTERYHGNIKQQMVIRHYTFYVNLFKEFGWEILKTEKWKKYDCQDEEMKLYILKKSI